MHHLKLKEVKHHRFMAKCATYHRYANYATL